MVRQNPEEKKVLNSGMARKLMFTPFFLFRGSWDISLGEWRWRENIQQKLAKRILFYLLLLSSLAFVPFLSLRLRGVSSVQEAPDSEELKGPRGGSRPIASQLFFPGKRFPSCLVEKNGNKGPGKNLSGNKRCTRPALPCTLSFSVW